MKQTILHIAPTPFFSDRGCHIRIEGIVRCLTELGYENTLCTYHHGRDISSVKAIRINPIKNYIQTEAGPNKYKLWADWKLLLLSLKQYKYLKPTVLHAHLHEGLLIALWVKLVYFWRPIIIVADMQGSLTGELDSHGSFDKYPILRWPTKTLEQFLMWAADHITCSSRHSLEKIRSEFNIPKDKISLTQDGADVGISLNASDKKALISKLGMPSNKTIIVYSGALLDSKGLVELKAIISDCTASPNLHFLIIGYPIKDLTEFLERNGLTKICTLTGRINFNLLSQYLSIADIAIDPKNSDAGEGSGKMLNYLASGLPVVAFNTENNVQFLPDNSPLANNVHDLTKQIIDLDISKSQRKKVGAMNKSFFLKNHSWQTTKAQLETVYRTLFP